MEEREWEIWRKIFNPGFSQAHIFTLIPTIVQQALAYKNMLSKYRLDEETLWFTMATSSMINNPQTLNKPTYTTAVIKEALRLFSPASSVRQGMDGVEITDDEGHKYPTANNAIIWIHHQAIHRNPKYWPQPKSFIPDRWMVEPGHPLYPVKWAWRPFEFGPRNCIGQELVMNELKVILGLKIREFDVKDAYE